MANINPIETLYNGYRFRSRLEARWAVFFDTIGIKYHYEPEGYRLSDGTCYLPDFYLPEMNEFFEVKGVLKLTDKRKVSKFIREYKRPVVIGYDEMEFDACSIPAEEYLWDGKDSSVLARCKKCHRLFFAGLMGDFTCQCCGHYDGDNTYNVLSFGNGDSLYHSDNYYVKAAKTRAKQARFEHGECG